jgi:hypothetical protein
LLVFLKAVYAFISLGYPKVQTMSSTFFNISGVNIVSNA